MQPACRTNTLLHVESKLESSWLSKQSTRRLHSVRRFVRSSTSNRVRSPRASCSSGRPEPSRSETGYRTGEDAWPVKSPVTALALQLGKILLRNCFACSACNLRVSKKNTRFIPFRLQAEHAAGEHPRIHWALLALFIANDEFYAALHAKHRRKFLPMSQANDVVRVASVF